MSRCLFLAQAIDGLYEAVIDQPESWTEERYFDWMTDVGADGVPPGAAKHLRAAVRVARKLQAHYTGQPRPAGDWHAAVDVAVGIPAWRPSLALLEAGWEESDDPELAAVLAERFRMVMQDEWSGNRP